MAENQERDLQPEIVYETLRDDAGLREDNDDRPKMMSATVEAWRTENIYITNSVKAITETVLSKDCVSVIGVPGAGKSTALHHAALSLEAEGFKVYNIFNPEEIFEFYDNNKKQAFVLDDVLGVYSVDQRKLVSWKEYNESVRNILGKNTKLVVSSRTQIFMHETLSETKFVFLDPSLTIGHVNLSDADYKLGIDDMRGLLKYHMNMTGIDSDRIDTIIKNIWMYTEKELSEMNEKDRQLCMSNYTTGLEFADCFPLLCKVFVSTEFVRQDPTQFFTDPFPAMKMLFQSIKSDNKHQWCALVLCAMLEGELNDAIFSAEINHGEELRKGIVLRNVIMSSNGLKGEKDLKEIHSALKALTGIYVFRQGDTYKISERVYYDIVTYLYNDPLFVFRYGTSEFIRDRVRLSKDEHEHDPYVIVYNDDKNIERLADRLVRDLKSKPEKGVELIVNNPNINDDRLFSCLRSKLSDREQTDKTLIDKLFRECMVTVEKDCYTNKNGDVTVYKLVEFCVQYGVDCNINVIGCGYPLHISAIAGSLQLTLLLLSHGADIRRVNVAGYSILHLVCMHTKCNKLDLVKLFTQHGDQSVVRFITSDREQMLQKLDHDNIQLEEVLPLSSVRILTTDKTEIKHYVDNIPGQLQLVTLLHDNILTYVNGVFNISILHFTVDDMNITKYLLGLPGIRQIINHRDMRGKTAYWYVVNRQHPHKDEVTVTDKDREYMMKLYKDNNGIL